MTLNHDLKYVIHVVVFVVWILFFEIICGAIPLTSVDPLLDFDPFER